MMLFGSQHRWLMRLAQGTCLIVSVCLAAVSASVWQYNNTVALVGFVCALLTFSVLLTIESALKSIDQTDRQKKSDACDIADLARSAVAAGKSISRELDLLPGQGQALEQATSQIQALQSNRKIRLTSLSDSHVGIQSLLEGIQSSLATSHADLLSKVSRARYDQSELRRLAAEDLNAPQKIAASLGQLEFCRTAVINLGIELASVVGDHPSFFAGASEVITRIKNVVESVTKEIAGIAEPREKTTLALNALEKSIHDTAKAVNTLEPVSAQISAAVDATALLPVGDGCSSLAGSHELVRLQSEASALAKAIAELSQHRQSSEKSANRALSSIDKATARNLNSEIHREQRTPLRTPDVDGEFDGDLSPAHERIREGEPRDQIEIAS